MDCWRARPRFGCQWLLACQAWFWLPMVCWRARPRFGCQWLLACQTWFWLPMGCWRARPRFGCQWLLACQTWFWLPMVCWRARPRFGCQWLLACQTWFWLPMVCWRARPRFGCQWSVGVPGMVLAANNCRAKPGRNVVASTDLSFHILVAFALAVSAPSQMRALPTPIFHGQTMPSVNICTYYVYV